MSAGWPLRLVDGATPEAIARCEALCPLVSNQSPTQDSLEGLCKGFMGTARYFDSKKKKLFNARYLITHILMHEGHFSAVPPAWLEDKRPYSRDFRKLLSQEPVTAVSLPPATQLNASHSPLPAEPITTPAVLFEVEATANTLQYTDLHSK